MKTKQDILDYVETRYANGWGRASTKNLSRLIDEVLEDAKPVRRCSDIAVEIITAGTRLVTDGAGLGETSRRLRSLAAELDCYVEPETHKEEQCQDAKDL